MKFRVNVAYDCSFTLEVDASSDSDAMDKAIELVEACDIPQSAKMLDRDFFVADPIPVENLNTLGG